MELLLRYGVEPINTSIKLKKTKTHNILYIFYIFVPN